jgi:uncharacterized protein YndB with AHSA1/START domain
MSSDEQMTASTERWVRVVRLLEASPERVHRAWSDPVELARWLCREIEGSLAVGTQSTLTWHDRRIDVEVLESDPPRIFRFRWAWGPAEGANTTVSVDLGRRGYGTQLRLSDGPFDLGEPGALDAYAEALQRWGEAIATLRAHVDFNVDIRARP